MGNLNNTWLRFSQARKLASFLQKKYFDMPCGDINNLLEMEILEDMWAHPLYLNDMRLNLFWDKRDHLLWLQIGYQEGLVPR